jgi:putative ABC transport system substrate-binding protein
MDRRRFLQTVSASLLAAPLAVEGQQGAKVARIGYLATDHLAASPPHLHEAFRQGLRDLGYVEGRNVVIEYQEAGGKLERLPALAAELVALKVDVIVAPTAASALVAKQATRTLPIVFFGSADPFTSGLVTSLARPGGNVTGLSGFSPGPNRQGSGTAQAGHSGGSVGSLSSGSQAPPPNARKKTR